MHPSNGSKSNKKNLWPKPTILLDQKPHSRANETVRIPFRTCYLLMLTVINYLMLSTFKTQLFWNLFKYLKIWVNSPTNPKVMSRNWWNFITRLVAPIVIDYTFNNFISPKLGKLSKITILQPNFKINFLS